MYDIEKFKTGEFCIELKDTQGWKDAIEWITSLNDPELMLTYGVTVLTEDSDFSNLMLIYLTNIGVTYLKVEDLVEGTIITPLEKSKPKIVLVEIYAYYGKYSGEELVESYFEEDTPKLRGSIVDEFSGGYGYDHELNDIRKFLKGSLDIFEKDSSGGDWDDPTAYKVVFKTYEEKQSELQIELDGKIKELSKKYEDFFSLKID